LVWFWGYLKKSIMVLETLSLNHFRNYSQQDVSFSPGLNLLSGPNGHGKTNMLEAIHYGCLAHSQRTRKDKELIQWNQRAFVLRLTGRSGKGATETKEQIQSVEFLESGHKRVKVNGVESKRLSDLIGHFSIVSFSPEDLDLIRGGPQIRRRFLDVLLCQFSLDYLDTLRRYNHTLKQRNSLLKQMGSGKTSMGNDVLEAFDPQLAETGARITVFRRRALADLGPVAVAGYRAISDGVEHLGMQLMGCVSELDDEGELQTEFLRKLHSLRFPEREAGMTLIGPHREDLLFTLNEKPVRDYGSQGQKRSVALSLKLASAQLLEVKNQQPPILLLDDVFAELDENRRRRIGDLVRNLGQVFIANPRAADLPFEAEKVITLHCGQVV
jgi:DNA replication and repair protein RecF